MKTLNLFVLFFILITNYAIGDHMGATVKKCDCNIIECIEVGKVEKKAGKNVEIDIEIKLKGFLASKSGWHPTHDRYMSSVLILEKPLCMYGSYVRGEGREWEISVIMTHFQIANTSNEFKEENANDRVLLTGTMYPRYTAWHTSELIMWVLEAEKIDMEWK
jgi:hypothetical protein